MTASTLARPDRRVRRLLAAGALVSALAVGGAVPAAHAAPADVADSAAGRWASAKLPVGAASLTGVAKPTPDTTWAAGFRLAENEWGLDFMPVVYAKNDRGGKWTEIPTAPGETGRVNAITATSAKNAWIVGDQRTGAPGDSIMSQHWDGRSWKSVDVPTAPDSVGGGLLGVSAVSPTDVWAAGWLQIQDTEVDSHNEGFISHWNGKRWNRVPLPNPYPSWGLNAISASGPNDVWAVGSGYGDDDKPTVLHYDGKKWTALPTPPFGGLYGEFNAVVANSPNDVWATGRSVLDEEDRGHALVMHWNGRAWKRIDVPEAAGPMYGVAAAPGGIVTVGQTTSRTDGYALRVVGTQATSLNLPANLPDGKSHSPWAVGVDRATRKATIVGVTEIPGQLPDPMLLTGRV